MRIALIKPSALGDIVHTLPVLSALRRRFPAAHISWIVNTAYAPLIANHPHLNAVLPFDRKGGLRAMLAFGPTLRRQRFDLVLDLQGLLRTGIMCGFTGAPRKVGFANAREGARHFYTERVDTPGHRQAHAVDRYWMMAEHLGCAGPKSFHLPIDAAEREAALQDLAELPRPWLAVAVGSRWTTKQWPPEHYADLLRTAPGSVLFVGTREDSAPSQVVANALRGPWKDFTGRTSLPRLAALLSACDAMIANDTGPLHLAAALGVPCVAPYTCTKVAFHGPYGVPGGVETRVACGGSYLKRCPHGMVCMKELSPAKLRPALDEVLASWQAQSPFA